MEIPYEFINDTTKAFFLSPKRNGCLCGGFGSGKTYVACFKVLFLSTNFSNYRTVIGRQEYKALKLTTLRTFEKICPSSLITRWDQQDGVMRLANGSEILWMHLDNVDEKTLRGLEINSVYLDQPEEISEGLYNILDARVGRWEKAYPGKHLAKSGVDFKKDQFGNWIVPSYMMLTPNPDVETHWIYRRYHPDSDENTIWKNNMYRSL